MRWLLALLLFWTGSAQAQSASAAEEAEVRAKRYLHACINAVATAVIESGQTTALNGKSCADPAFGLAQFLGDAARTPAVTSSRIEFGTGGLEDFKIYVTDTRGAVWTGALNDYPKLPPRLSSRTPEQLAQTQAAAFQVAAQNVLRTCVTALETYRVDNGDTLNTAWDGQSCQDAGLIDARGGAAISRSLITLHPETVEGYQITVWPQQGGAAVTLPEVLTPKPTRIEQAIRSGEALSWLIGTVVGAALLYGFVFKVPSREWAGSMGLLAAGLAVGILILFLIGSNLPAVEWNWLLIALPLLVPGGGLLFAVPRLVYWFGREKWWVSLGLGILAALFSVFVLGYVNTALPNPGTSSPDLFGAFYGLPILSMLLTLALLWRRFRPARPAL